MMKKYWFTIEPYVYISIKKNLLLLYNSYTGNILEYANKTKILNLVKKLKSRKNLGVILLKEKELEDSIILKFVEEIKENFMGDLFDTTYSSGKPVQMKPILTINKDIKYLKKDKERSVGEDLMKYLTEIFLYINSECGYNCDICSKAYRQFHCCTKNERIKTDLDIDKIDSLRNELPITSLVNINILGGNIFLYPKFDKLIASLCRNKAQKTIYCHYLNINAESSQIGLIEPNSYLLKILVSFPLDKNKLITAVKILNKKALKSKYTFIIQDEREVEQSENIIKSLNITDYDFQPFYNGMNIQFFKKNVFIDKEEVIGAKPSMKDIYRNMMINSLNFGRLTVYSNGYIHGNINTRELGILGKDSLYDVVYREMYQGKNWRRTRKNVEPCKRCTFFALCPPTSNYSYAIGENDLCHMNISV